MADINEILGRNIDSVKSLKDAIKELQNSLIGVDTESEQFKTTSQQLAAAQEELTKVTNAGKDANNAAKDSIVGMQQEYKNLYDTYKALSEEERNSPFGKGMAESLASLSEKINTSKKEVGNFTSNIGQYAQGATEAFNKLGISAGGLQKPLSLASTGAKGFNTALKTLSANPIILVITTLVAILAKAAAAIKQNEELSNRLKQAMATFKPILDAVANAFDFLAGIIVKVVEGLAKVAEKIMSVIPGMKDAIKSHKDLAKATNDLTKAQREANVENSKKQAEVERLRAEAAATTDVIEKQKLLEEAKAKQAEIDQTNIALAQEELRIAEEYAAKTANSAEANERLAATQKKVNDAIAQGEANMRLYNKQLTTLTKTETKATGGGGGKSKYQQQKEEAQKLYQQLIENNKSEIQKLTEKYEKEKKLLEKYHIDTKLLTKKYNEDIAKLRTDETKKSIDIYRKSLTDYNKTFKNWTEYDRATMSPIDQLKDDISVLEKEVPRELQKLSNLKNQVYNYAKETNNQGLFDAFFQVGFQRSDLTSLVNDYEEVLNTIKEKRDKAYAEFKKAEKENDPNKEIIEVQYNQYKGAFDALTKLGEENWIKLTKQVSIQAQNLAERYGIQDFSLLPGDFFEIKKNEIKEKYGEIAKLIIDTTVKGVEEANLNQKLEAILEGDWTGAMERVNAVTAEYTWESLEAQKTALEEQLTNFKGTHEQQLEILAQYYSVVEEMAEKHADLQNLQTERTKTMIEDLLNMTDQLGSALDTMQSSWKTVTDAELNAGIISKKEADKKKKQYLEMEKVATAFNVATILGDLATGSFDIWRGYIRETTTINPQTAQAAGMGSSVALAALNAKSLISAIAKQTSLAATASAQIAAARGKYKSSAIAFSQETGSEGGSVGVATTPALIDSTPYTYTRTVQTTDEEDKLNQPIWVSVVDVENALGHQVQVREESSF